MRILCVLCIFTFWTADVFSQDRVIQAVETVENNICTQTFRIDENVVERIEVYPAKRAVGDAVYAVSYWENVSNKTIPDVCTFWLGFVRPYARSWKDYGTRPTPPPVPLNPGEKRLRWFLMLQDDFFENMSLHSGEEFPIKGELSPFKYENYNEFSYDGSKLWIEYKRVNLCDTYSRLNLQDLFFIRKWYNFERPRWKDISPPGSADIDWEMTVSPKNPLPTGDDVYDLYVGDTAMGADETLLSASSTVRDEIKLTRLIFEYLHASESEETSKMQEVTSFVDSQPLPQKIFMTHRLIRLEKGVAFTGIHSWPSWYVCAPPPLSEEWEAKLQRLNAAFLEIRENALEK